MSDTDWQWDESLYRGSADHYAVGRVAYPQELIAALAQEVPLDGTGRLLDVGCGPGSLTIPLAAHVADALGVDADADMLTVAARTAEAAGVHNMRWLRCRAEFLPDDVGRFDAITLAQSFHWMDRPAVARVLAGVLAPGGALVHVHATTHAGVDGVEPLPHPRPPRDAIGALVEHFLGSRRRAGQGTLPDPPLDEHAVGRVEDGIYRAAGFRDQTRLEIPGRVVTRSTDEIVASVFSLSSAAPHLFGARVAEFETGLRELLHDASADGVFSEQLREIAVDVWRR